MLQLFCFLFLVSCIGSLSERPTVYILDLVNHYGPLLGLPSCTNNTIAKHKEYQEKRHGGEADGGQLYHLPPIFDLHKAQHSAEWWLWVSLYHSGHRTSDLETADLVLVHWWCYLRLANSLRHVGVPWLTQMWAEVTSTERYQRHAGADYLVFLPHPFLSRVFCASPGLNPIQVVVEEHQVCRRGDRHIIAPYLALAASQRPSEPLQDRSTLVTFSGSCTPAGQVLPASAADTSPLLSAGKVQRRAIVEELVQAAGTRVVQLRCSGGITSVGATPNATAAERLVEISRSVFCLVLAGETVSSRLLSEVVLAGCLPVLVGPPFHNLPLEQHVNYSRFTLIFRHTHLGEKVAANHRDAFHCGFHPPVGAGAVHDVSTYAQILDHLAAIDVAEVERMQSALREFQRYFVMELFLRDVRYPRNMNDAILHTAMLLSQEPVSNSKGTTLGHERVC